MKGPGGQHCHHCGTTTTPCWRKGAFIEGTNVQMTLCNACGARFLVKRDLTGYLPHMSGRTSRKSCPAKPRRKGVVKTPRAAAGASTDTASQTGGHRCRRRGFVKAIAIFEKLPATNWQIVAEGSSPKVKPLDTQPGAGAVVHKEIIFAFRRKPRKSPSPQVAAVC